MTNDAFCFPVTPVQTICHPVLDAQNITLDIKREDLNDPYIQGNKWLKIRPSLIAAKQQGQNTLLTFGGCYSNHIYAMAAAGQRFGFNTIGLIRGPQPAVESDTLKFARQCDMEIHFLSREEFRQSRDETNLQNLLQDFGPVFIIPEGGTTSLAVDSCAKYIQTAANNYDVICTAVGTGGTIAGFIKGLNKHQHVIGFPALKNADFLLNDIENMLTGYSKDHASWQLVNDYTFGGYARSTDQLEKFILNFYSQHHILLEPVYTGKMLFGLFDLIKKQYFKPGSRILAIHTGGLQGLTGFPRLKHLLQVYYDQYK